MTDKPVPPAAKPKLYPYQKAFLDQLERALKPSVVLLELPRDLGKPPHKNFQLFGRAERNKKPSVVLPKKGKESIFFIDESHHFK